MSLCWIAQQVASLRLASVGLLESLAGGFVSIFSYRRRMLSLLDSIYSVQSNRQQSDIVHLPDTLVDELTLISILSPLAVTDIRTPYDEFVSLEQVFLHPDQLDRLPNLSALNLEKFDAFEKPVSSGHGAVRKKVQERAMKKIAHDSITPAVEVPEVRQVPWSHRSWMTYYSVFRRTFLSAVMRFHGRLAHLVFWTCTLERKASLERQ